MAPSSQSKARRQRAAAVKRRLWHKTLPEQSFPKQVPVQQCGDLSVLMVQQILHMNGIILQWLVAGSPSTYTVPLYTDGTICGSVPAEDGSGMVVGSGGGDPVANVGETFLAEPVATESFSGEHGDAAVEDRLAEVVANVWCNGCWEELPSFCGCGSLRLCGECAGKCMASRNGEGDALDEPTYVEAAGDATEGVTVDMVRVELERMAANVERMGSFGGGVQDMMGQMREIEERMVSREAYERLVNRLGQLEAGVGRAEVQAERFDEHTGYTDDEGDEDDEGHSGYIEDEGDVSDYGYFDGDGNSIPSEDEHTKFED